MFLLDTDTCTHLMLEQSATVDNATRVASRGDVVGTTVITWIEILRGRFEALMKANSRSQFLIMQHRLQDTEQSLRRVDVYPLDHAALDHFERLTMTKRLKKIGRADLLIASIVLANNATLVTRNVKHFSRIPRLKYVNWAD